MDKNSTGRDTHGNANNMAAAKRRQVRRHRFGKKAKIPPAKYKPTTAKIRRQRRRQLAAIARRREAEPNTQRKPEHVRRDENAADKAARFEHNRQRREYRHRQLRQAETLGKIPAGSAAAYAARHLYTLPVT